MKSVKEDRNPRTRKILFEQFEVQRDNEMNISFKFKAKRDGQVLIFFQYEDEVTLFDVNEFKIQ